MTTQKPTVTFFPEDTFLNPNVKIDPIEMSNTLLDRIRAILGMIRDGANADATYQPSQLATMMDTVEGNIDMLERVFANLQEEKEGKVIPLFSV